MVGELEQQSEPNKQAINNLLQQMGVNETAFELQLLKGGWNNRVYRLCAGTTSYALKAYFVSEFDSRPRLKHEWAFLTYCQGLGLTSVPKPVAMSKTAHLAVYSWVEGLPYGGQDSPVSDADLQTALDFLQRLHHGWQRNSDFERQNLPPASEYCPDLGAHIQHLEARLKRLSQISASTHIHQKVHQLVLTRLLPLWQRIRADLSLASRQQPDLWRALKPDEHCLSPSDFGFHNALKTRLGPVFLDFEYAGWDDPAQLVCDFFAQFQVPVPETVWADFTGTVASWYPDPDWHLKRMNLVRPIHELKWMCIALNHFLNQGSQRRAFATATEGEILSNQETRQIQEQQYNKALSLIKKLEAAIT